MPVSHAILGILARRPSYPYEIVVSFEHRIGPAWQVSKGQVYRTIYRLEEEGLVQRAGSKPNSHGARSVFKITDRGHKDLERWRLTHAQRVKPWRDDLLVKIAIATPEDAPELLRAIDVRRNLLSEKLAEYTQVATNQSPLGPARWDELGPALSMKAALAQLNTEMDLLDGTREAIARFSRSSVPAERRKAA